MSGLSAGTAFVDVQPKLGAGFQSGIASKLGPIGLAGGAALAGGIAAGVGGAVALKNIGDTFDDAFDTIRVGTGATGEALEALKGDFKTVLSNVPTDAATAATAIADLNTRTGATGETLQELATQTLELGRITGEDTATLIEKTTRTMGDWDVAVEDGAGALDALFRASQATGPPVSRLSDLLVQYGAPLRQFGFGMEESAALLGKFEKEGVNTELVMGSLRIGLGKLARAGEDPAEAFPRLVDEIQNAGSSAEANAKAMDLFGARAGPDMAAAITEGRFEVGELFDAVSQGSETISSAVSDTDDYRQSWERLKNRVMVALAPLAERFLEALGRLFDFLADNAGPVIETFAGILSGVGDSFGGVGEKVSGFAGTIGAAFEYVKTVFTFIGTVVGDLFGGVTQTVGENSSQIGGILRSLGDIFRSLFEVATGIFSALQAFWDQWGGLIVAIFQGSIGNVIAILSGAFDVIAGIFDVVLGILTGDWTRAWEGIKRIFSGVIGAIIDIVRNVSRVLIDIWHHLFGNGIIPDTIRGGLDRILGFFSELPGKIVGFLAGLPGRLLQLGKDLVSGLVNGLGNIASAVGSKIKSGISSAISGVKSFFGIGSPSRVFAEELGLPLAQGVALGAEETGRLAGAALVSGIDDAARNAASAVPAFAGAAPDAVRGTAAGAAAGALAASGDAGTYITLEDGAVQVYNPEPEPASDNVPRELRRLAATLGRK